MYFTWGTALSLSACQWREGSLRSSLSLSFAAGVPCFLLNFVFCGVIVYQNSLATVIVTSVISGLALVVWWIRVERKWSGFLTSSTGNLVKQIADPLSHPEDYQNSVTPKGEIEKAG